MKKKIRKLITLFTLGFASSTMVFALAQNVFDNETLNLTYADENSEYYFPRHLQTNFLTLDTDPTENVWSVNLRLSPQPRDYKSLSKDAIKDSFTTVVEGIKDIVSSQMHFIQDVVAPFNPTDNTIENPSESMTIDEQTGEVSIDYEDDGTISFYDSLIKDIVSNIIVNDEDETYTKELDPEKIKAFDEASQIVDEEVEKSSDPTSFLRLVIAYLSSYDSKDSDFQSDIIDARLGKSGEDFDLSKGIGKSLSDIYRVIYDNEEVVEQKAKADLEKIYDIAVSITEDTKIGSSVITRILLSLGSTTIPTNVLVDVLGSEDTKNAVEDIFVDGYVSDGKMVLDNLSTTVVDELCKAVDFTKDEIIEVVAACSNSKLLEIFNALEANGLDNIRVILGNANNSESNDKEPEPTKNMPKRPLMASAAEHSDGGSKYAEFGNQLIKEVMQRITPGDLLQAITKLTVDYDSANTREVNEDGEEVNTGRGYLFYTNEPDEFGNAQKDFKLTNIRYWIRDVLLEKLKQVRYLPDSEQHMPVKLEIYTPLSPDTPIYINFDIGFQDKNCNYVRRLAELIDDHLDIIFDDNDINKYHFVFRAPLAIDNLYGWICQVKSELDDNYVIDNDNHLLNDLWNLEDQPIQATIDYIREKSAQDIANILDEVNYEYVVKTITTADLLSELLGYEGITDSRLERAYSLLQKLVHKGANVDYDSIADFVVEVLGSSASKIVDNSTIRNLVEKVQDLLAKLDGKDISLEHIKEITNEDVHGYIEKITGKVDLVNRARDLVVKVLDFLPERLKQTSYMDLYRGNGHFGGQGSYSPNWESLIKRIPKIGKRLWEALFSFTSGMPEHIDATVDAYLNETYSITYEHEEDDTTVSHSGLLNVGSDVMTFGDMATYNGKEIIHWVKKGTPETTVIADKNRIDTMPAEDIVVVPETKYEATISTTSIEDVYGKNKTHDVSVTIDDEHENAFVYTYQWQKLNGSDFEDVSGETNSTLTVSDVLDSGIYRCVVNNNDDFNNYEDSEVITESVEVTITPKGVDISPVTWDYTESFTYDGSEKSISYGDTADNIEGIDYDNITVTGDDASQTDAGDYTTTVNFELVDEDNYYFTNGDSVTQEWSIKPEIVTLTDIDDQESDWTGSELTLDIAELFFEKNPDLEGKVQIVGDSITNNSNVGPGEYTVSFDVEPVSSNYQIDGSTTLDFVWKINREIIDISFDLVWLIDGEEANNTNTEIIYDRQEHEVEIDETKLPDDFFDIFEINYEGITSRTKPQDAINTKAVVSFKTGVDPTGYNVTCSTESSINWCIKKAPVDLSQVHWVGNTSYDYDGLEHSVHVEGYDASLLEPHYENATATEPGEYTASVTFTLKDEDCYYIADEFTTTYTWHIIAPQGEKYNVFTTDSQYSDVDGNYVGRVILQEGIEQNLSMSVTNLDASTIDTSKLNFEDLVGTSDGKIVSAYDYDFTYNNEPFSLNPEDEMDVEVLIPQELRGKDFAVVILNEDGSVTKIEDYTISESGLYVEFKATSLDKIAFIVSVEKEPVIEEKSGVLPLIIIAGLSQLVLMTWATIRSKKDADKAQENIN